MSGGRGAVLVEVIKAALSGAGFLYLAAMLGPTQYGFYAVVVAVAAILIPGVSLGINWWIQPLVLEKGLSAALAALNSAFVRITLALSIIAAVVGALAFSLDIWQMVWLLITELALYPVWTIASLGYLAAKRVRAYVIISAAIPAGKLLATALAFGVLDGDLTLWAIVAFSTGTLGYIVTIAAGRPSSWSAGNRELARWSRRGIGFAGVGIISALTDNLDRSVVGAMLPSHQVGTYAVAARVAAYGTIPVKGLSLVAYPRYFALVGIGEVAEARQLMYRTIRKAVLWALPMMLLLPAAGYVISEWILTAYQGLLPALSILMILVPIRAVVYGTGDMLYALGKTHVRLLVLGIGALATLAFVLTGAFVIGLMGAAIGLVLAAMISAAAQVSVCEHYFRSADPSAPNR